ncbi:MAG: Gfo/Idh/MocA family protein [Planctomycetota bacterium]
MTTTAPIPFAMVGCGDISAGHGRCATANGYRLAAVYNPTRSKASAFAAEWGDESTRVHDGFQAVCEDPAVSVVVIASPPHVHAEQVCAALAAGKHVLCEKPAGLHPADCVRICAADEASAASCAFFSSRLRHGGYTATARRAIEAGRLGPIYRAEIRFARVAHRPGIDWLAHAAWFTDRSRAGGGVLMDMGQYLLDQTLDLLGWPAVAHLLASTFQGFPHDLPPGRINDVEEQAAFLATLEGGIALSCDVAAMATHPPVHRITLLGRDGGLCIDHSGDEHRYSLVRVDSGTQLLEETPQFAAAAWETAGIYRAFAAHIDGAAPHPGTTSRQALQLSRICALAYASAERGHGLTPDALEETPTCA